MWRCHVIHNAEAVLLLNIGRLYSRLFTDFATNSLERIGAGGHIEFAFKKAADNMVPTIIHIYTSTFVEQDMSIRSLEDRTDRERISKFLASASLRKP